MLRSWGSLVVVGASLYLQSWAPPYLSQETHIILLWGLGAPLKGSRGSCQDEAGGSSGVPLGGSSLIVVGGSSLIVVGDSSLPVAWGFLSSCGVLVGYSLAAVYGLHFCYGEGLFGYNI